jgi:flagellar FliJ protein
METPFRFGLERVRDLRVHDEAQAKEAFAASLSQRLRGQAMLHAAEQLLQDARAAAPGDDGAPLTGAALMSRQAWVDRLQRSRDDAATRLTGLDVHLQRSRETLTDASRAREVLDQLKARQRDAHRLRAERRQGAELDEMALRAYVRRAAA